MQAISKQEIKNEIEKLQHQQLIEKDIRKTVEEFKHYKKVNKRFTDRLSELGYHAYMIKDYSHKLRVSKSIEPYQNVSIEIYVYGQELTWEKIIQELEGSNFKGREKSYREKLQSFDSDIEQLKKLYEMVLSMKDQLKSFDLWRLESDLRNTIENSK